MGIAGVVISAMLAVAGCASLMNPYLRSSQLKCDGSTATASCTPSPREYAGGATSAIAAANDQRSLYIRGLGNQYISNSLAGLGIIGLSADAIYEGLASSSKSSLLTKETAAIAGLYGADTWLHNKSTEAAYIVGFQAITCTLLRSRAILLPITPDPQDAGRGSGEPRAPDDGYEHRLDKFDLQDFETATNQFEAQIQVVDGLLSDLQIDWDTGEEAGNALADGENASLKRETSNVINTLARARKLLLNARAYEAEINTAGPTIRNQVDLIIASVNTQLAQSEPNIATLKGLVSTYTDPSKGIAGLQSVTLTPAGSTVTPPFYEPATNPIVAAPGSAAQKDAQARAAGIASTPNDYAARVAKRKALWEAVSSLYALGRPINSVLGNAQHFYASTKRVSACDLGGSAAPLEITPSTVEDPVAPGKTFKFAISGGTGIPEVSLTGSTGTASADAKTSDLTLSVNGNSIIAAVTVMPDASGTLTLVASDKGTPPQQVKVTLDVEKAATPTKPTFKVTAGDKKAELLFATPSAKAATLSGYSVKLTSAAPSATVTLKFASPTMGTKATGGATITGNIAADSSGNTTIDLNGLTNGRTYTASLSANFSGAADVVYEDVPNIKPAAPVVAAPKPKLKPKAKPAPAKVPEAS